MTNNVSTFFPDIVFYFIGRDEVDLTKLENIDNHFKRNHYDYIVNCAAYTHVDNSETHSQLADKINNIAVRKIAHIAKSKNIYLIHISTDYVFDGKSKAPYKEDNKTNPINNYGASKLNGELAIKEVNPRGAIIRTSWLYSEFGNNFIKTILKVSKGKSNINVISDQLGSPTYASDLATVIASMISSTNINKSKLQLYHYSNEGFCSWYSLAKKALELVNSPCYVTPIKAKDYPSAARRPNYSVLNSQKLLQDLTFPSLQWDESLKKCISCLFPYQSNVKT